jgi:hypothetical protein
MWFGGRVRADIVSIEGTLVAELVHRRTAAVEFDS